ncbi:hypothetical protein ALC56_02067 [Trachymyrmex septentrionalis]|uniref:Uncharacterized protein n=1 Tax=Trachymyrmex septentrionalis TaxID=34720 RepID=A0A195FVB2_9HYME|nr:hypothetical protein ALC56_02067 [Trachymyrmex septentrionalis]
MIRNTVSCREKIQYFLISHHQLLILAFCYDKTQACCLSYLGQNWGLTANNFEDSIALHHLARDLRFAHASDTPASGDKAFVTDETDNRNSEKEREDARECACPRFYHPRKAYKLTPLCPKERLTTTPGLCDSRSIYSKLTEDVARLREVSCWIYLGFEPTTLELSTELLNAQINSQRRTDGEPYDKLKRKSLQNKWEVVERRRSEWRKDLTCLDNN